MRFALLLDKKYLFTKEVDRWKKDWQSQALVLFSWLKDRSLTIPHVIRKAAGTAADATQAEDYAANSKEQGERWPCRQLGAVAFNGIGGGQVQSGVEDGSRSIMRVLQKREHISMVE